MVVMGGDLHLMYGVRVSMGGDVQVMYGVRVRPRAAAPPARAATQRVTLVGKGRVTGGQRGPLEAHK